MTWRDICIYFEWRPGKERYLYPQALEISIFLRCCQWVEKESSSFGLWLATGTVAAPQGRVPQGSFKPRNLPWLPESQVTGWLLGAYSTLPWLYRSSLLCTFAFLRIPQNQRLGVGRWSGEACQSEKGCGLRGCYALVCQHSQAIWPSGLNPSHSFPILKISQRSPIHTHGVPKARRVL